MRHATRRLMAVAVLGLCTVAAGRAEAGTLLGNDFISGVLYDVDTSTGAATNPRGGGIGHVAGIAFRSDGTLFGLTAFGGSPANSLVTIDPTTGASTLVGPTGLTGIVEGDITFSPTTGILYGLSTSPGFGLFTINTAT